MAVLVGVIAAVMIQAQQPGRSTDLDTASTSFGGGVVATKSASGSLASPGVRTAAPTGLSGSEASATHLWENSILIPNKVSLGLVMSTQTFTAELWNTYRRSELKITSAPLTGTGDLYMTGAIPATLGPLGSSTYTVTVPQKGSATISQAATFNLLRLTDAAASSRVLNVSGIRVLLFPFDPDWTDPVLERTKHLTQIMTARSGKEQRISLRTKPRRELAFTAFADDVGQAQLLDSMLTDALPEAWGVPWWMDATIYSGTLAQGAVVIPVSTVDRMFGDASMVLLWSSATSWEVQTIESVSANAIACTPLSKNWTNPLVVPLFTGRLADSQPLEWLNSQISKAAVKFEVEA